MPKPQVPAAAGMAVLRPGVLVAAWFAGHGWWRGRVSHRLPRATGAPYTVHWEGRTNPALPHTRAGRVRPGGAVGGAAGRQLVS